ncbi:MAG: glycosyltransferase family 1 protein [Desulfobacterales bacterium]|nr:glycosyltransferase family 1 protein [Desulfobacterales bacterium]
MRVVRKRVLVDAREFVLGRFTGIGRVLKGIVEALAESPVVDEIVLATHMAGAIPSSVRNLEKIRVQEIPKSFLKTEKALAHLSKTDFKLYFSPYPKLPLFGCHCSAVNIVHDVLDLTHPAYRRRVKVFLDMHRVKNAIKRADLTWYDSLWSMEETKNLIGFVGKNPKVRPLGIDVRFTVEREENEYGILKKYDLQPGYILVVGNGLSHKNPGVLLRISDNMSRRLVFVGVSERSQNYWKRRYPEAKAVWVKYVEEEDLPSLIRFAFCLAQPSTAEGYGYPPLEAMACGVPAIVSNIQVLVETTGENVLVANPEDSRAWLEAFDKLEDQSERKTYIDKGLKWVKPLQGREGWKNHIADIEEVLEGKK